MIPAFSERLSIVIQGKLVNDSVEVLSGFRSHFPGSQIILSCWDTCDLELITDSDVEVVVSADPGGNKIIGSPTKEDHLDNTCRQIVSFAAGFKLASRDYVLKWRSDARCNFEALRSLIQNFFLHEAQNDKKFLVSGFFSLDSRINPAWNGHLSDWFYLTSTKNYHMASQDRIVRLLSAREGNLRVSKSISAEFFGFPTVDFTGEQLCCDFFFAHGANSDADDRPKDWRLNLKPVFIDPSDIGYALSKDKYSDLMHLYSTGRRGITKFHIKPTVAYLKSNWEPTPVNKSSWYSIAQLLRFWMLRNELLIRKVLTFLRYIPTYRRNT